MYDPPHLIKNIRNNLKKHGYTIGHEVISWDHINQFFQIDSSTPIRMAPKLTNRHITLPAFANLNVALAVQVLSRTVAAGISSMVRSGELPVEASATSKFALNFDELFDCFNSHALYGKREVSGAITSTSMHVGFLKEKLKWIRTIRCRNRNGKLPCLDGWQLSINSVIQLWEDLSVNCGVSFLITSRLNQDPLENLFSVIRSKGGHRSNPDPREFRSAITQTMVDNILLTAESSNCKADVDTFLFSLGNIASKGSPAAMRTRMEQDVPTNLRPLLKTPPALPALSVPEANTLVFISGYVAMKLKKIVCEDCSSLLCTQRMPNHPHHMFIMEKQYNPQGDQGLTTPSLSLTSVLRDAEKCFRQSIASHLVTTAVRYKLVMKMVQATSSSTLVCPSAVCKLKLLALTLFTNIRLHYHLKCMKRDMAVQNSRISTQRKSSIFRHQ